MTPSYTRGTFLTTFIICLRLRRKQIFGESIRKQIVGYFQTALAQDSVDWRPFRATSETTPELLFLPELPPKGDKGLGRKPGSIAIGGQRGEFVALCCRSSPHLAMSLPSLRGALPRCGSSPRAASAAATQMGASVGWLKRNSGCSVARGG